MFLLRLHHISRQLEYQVLIEELYLVGLKGFLLRWRGLTLRRQIMCVCEGVGTMIGQPTLDFEGEGETMGFCTSSVSASESVTTGFELEEVYE